MGIYLIQVLCGLSGSLARSAMLVSNRCGDQHSVSEAENDAET